MSQLQRQATAVSRRQAPPWVALGITVHGGWIGAVLASVYLVWLLNLYNFMDGIDWMTVAEVVKSEHCFAQVKVGDKLVFDPFLNPQKSSGVMCPKALLPVLTQIGAIWEMAAEWAEAGKERASSRAHTVPITQAVEKCLRYNRRHCP